MFTYLQVNKSKQKFVCLLEIQLWSQNLLRCVFKLSTQDANLLLRWSPRSPELLWSWPWLHIYSVNTKLLNPVKLTINKSWKEKT